jgi:hypothetical protein
MANSKHVEEILDTLRSHTLTACTSGDTEIGIIAVDTYPEETKNIILLSNGKKITSDDLEFSELVIGETEIKIFLGNYIFHLQRRNS